MPALTPQVEPCPPADRAEALAVLYRRVPGALRPRLISDALRDAARGEIDLSGLWVARRRGRIVGAMLTQPLAGRAVAVWAPEIDSNWRRGATAISLVRAVLADLKGREYRIAQALLDESAPRTSAADLAGGGMPHVTELLYLERLTADPLPPLPDGVTFDWRGFSAATDAEFRAVLQSTYVDSLDMPELEGIRSLDDILSGHRTSGRFVPERWRVGRVRGEPDATAVVLLSEIPDRDAWEVAYLGLSPAARGRGLGLTVLAHALDLAVRHVPRIELAVDVRNTPANRLYHAAGFLPFDRRAVHLANLAT